MRVSDVGVELVDDELRISIACESAGGAFAPFELVVEVPRIYVGLVDASPAALAPILYALAAQHGESVDLGDVNAGLRANQGWVGLDFDGGLDACAALVHSLDGRSALRVSHLVVIEELDDQRRSTGSARMRSVEALAADLGLGSLPVRTNALNMPQLPGIVGGAAIRDTVARVLPAVAALMTPTPTPPDALATVASDRRVLQRIVVCEHAEAPPNCGRCRECLRVLTELAALRVELPDRLFERELTEDAIAACALDGDIADLLAMTARLTDEHDELGRWWSEALAARLAQVGDAHITPVHVKQLAWAVARTGARVSVETRFGWRAGEVPLRPPHDGRHMLLRAVHEPRERPVAWAMLDADGDGPGAARLASLLTHEWGQGLVWGYGPSGPLDAESLASTLGATRVRVWWSEQGGLDAARALETIEHGCLPLQAMPPVGAAAARVEIPERLRDLVVAVDGAAPALPTAAEVGRRLRAAAAVLVAGSLERDLLASDGRAA